MAKENPATKPGPDDANQKGPKKGKRKAKERLQERAKLAGVLGYEKMTEKQLRNELQRIKSEGGSVVDLRAENSQPVSLSKDPLVLQIKRKHLMEEREFAVTDQEGKRTKQKMTTLEALLGRLLKDSMHGQTVRERVAAIHEYFDRTLGKSPQEVEFSGEIKESQQVKPSRKQIMAAIAAEQAYDKVMRTP